MAEQYISMSSLANKLETASGPDFQNILRSLSSPVYVNEKLVKSELGLLNARIQKLLRSSNDYDSWKGCHATATICSYNPLFLLTFGGQSLTAVFAKLDQKAGYYSNTIVTRQGKTLLETLVCTLTILIDLMRNKPSLSRESLVPKLKAIIPTLINLCQYEPQLCLPVLKKLLYKHSTTFKPFANKYRAVLTKMIAHDYEHFSKDIQVQICQNYAYLHLIKIHASQAKDENESHHQIYSDDNWRAGLFSILIQFSPIIKLCDNILDFNQDKELLKFFDSLPTDQYKDYKIEQFLPSLKLDMNDPFTLWEIPTRLNLLVDLLNAFVTSPTPFPIRVPIGSINSICEALVSISTKYLPLKRELRRDQDLNVVIGNILPQVQYSGIKLWTLMLESYGNCYLSMSDRILASLEVFIPFKPKSNAIDFTSCQKLRSEFLQVFKLASLVLSQMGHQLVEIDSIMKLIDVALYLTEDRSLIDHIFNNQIIKNTQGSNQTNKRQKKDSNNTGALSDLFTNYEQFEEKNPIEWYDAVNGFLVFILSNWKLSTSQQVGTIKYCISKSLKLREQNGFIPQSFIKLLRIIVVNSGNERVSILPIAVSLLKESSDETFDLLCHPRLPMSIIHNVKKISMIEETEAEQEQQRIVSQVEAQPIDIIDDISELNDVVMPKLDEKKIENDETKVFRKRGMEEIKVEEENTKRNKVEQLVQEQIANDERLDAELGPIVKNVETETKEEEEKEEEESDFEIPDIQLSEYEDDEEE